MNKALQRPATTPAIQKRLKPSFDRDLAVIRALKARQGAILKCGGRSYVLQRGRGLLRQVGAML